MPLNSVLIGVNRSVQPLFYRASDGSCFARLISQARTAFEFSADRCDRRRQLDVELRQSDGTRSSLDADLIDPDVMPRNRE